MAEDGIEADKGKNRNIIPHWNIFRFAKNVGMVAIAPPPKKMLKQPITGSGISRPVKKNVKNKNRNCAFSAIEQQGQESKLFTARPQDIRRTNIARSAFPDVLLEKKLRQKKSERDRAEKIRRKKKQEIKKSKLIHPLTTPRSAYPAPPYAWERRWKPAFSSASVEGHRQPRRQSRRRGSSAPDA